MVHAGYNQCRRGMAALILHISLRFNALTQLRELYELLSANYVEDDDASFRFQYSAEFLSWALMPPGFHRDWHIGVRVSSSKKLVAFISAVPIRVRVRQK